MFLAASPYFQHRFSSSPYLLTHFPSYITSVATITNVVSMAILTHLQRSASYPRRIVAALCLNIVSFTLLAISTTFFRSISPQAYFAFLMLMVFMASLSAGLCQNGIFAYVSGFRVPKYTQGIMTGQAVAGVLPCIAQIVSVLSVSESENPGSGAAQESSKSAFVYFLTATVISAITLLAFLYLVRRHNSNTTSFPQNKLPSTPPPPPITTTTEPTTAEEEQEDSDPQQPGQRKPISLLTLFLKLRYLSLAVFTCFLITMFFPIYTQSILSVHTPVPPSTTLPRLLQPPTFIPLAFLFWNTGDLLGRLLTALPLFSRITHYPRTLLLLSITRVIFIPLYMLCNIRGRGAVVRSDVFYLVGVQFLFGLSNGWIGSACMMGAGEWVGEGEGEKEAAGGWMGLCLVAGLGVGSLLSFLAA